MHWSHLPLMGMVLFSTSAGQSEHLTPTKAHQCRGFCYLDPARSQILATRSSGRSPSGSSQSPSSAKNFPTKAVESDISIWANGDFSIWRLHLSHNDGYGMSGCLPVL
jgi:hypothetical protein